MLLSLSDLVLLSPSSVQFLVESIDLVFLLSDDVIDLYFDAFAALLEELV